MFYVYVLRSQASGMRYVGQSQDLHERLANGRDLETAHRC
jgi:predicted GIY-YIG superfamily endonuclease